MLLIFFIDRDPELWNGLGLGLDLCLSWDFRYEHGNLCGNLWLWSKLLASDSHMPSQLWKMGLLSHTADGVRDRFAHSFVVYLQHYLHPSISLQHSPYGFILICPTVVALRNNLKQTIVIVETPHHSLLQFLCVAQRRQHNQHHKLFPMSVSHTRFIVISTAASFWSNKLPHCAVLSYSIVIWEK